MWLELQLDGVAFAAWTAGAWCNPLAALAPRTYVVNEAAPAAQQSRAEGAAVGARVAFQGWRLRRVRFIRGRCSPRGSFDRGRVHGL